MNHIAAIVSVLALAASFAAVADKPTQAPCAVQQKPAGAKQCKAAAKTTVAATALLSDGSTIKGELLMPKITGSTVFLGKLALNPAIVKSIAFSGADNTAKVELENGDMFTIKVRDRSFTVKSVLGKLEIPRRAIRSLTLAKRRATAKGGDGLVFYCTFDDEASTEAPAAGPTVKMELGKIVSDKGKTGGALFVNPGIAGAQIAFPSGSFGTEGCIEFWANMASGKTEFSTGGDPRFFLLSTKDGTEIAHFEYASNNGCGNSGLGGHICGLRTQTNSGCSYLMPYSAVFKGEDYNGWHHYAFVWSTTELAIYVDGKLFCRTEGKLNAAQIDGEVIMDIPLNRLSGKSFNNKSAFYMDELKVWNYAKREFNIK